MSCSFSGAESTSPQVLVDGPSGTHSLTVLPVSEKLFRAAFLPREAGQYRFRVEHPRIPARDQTVSIFMRGGQGNAVVLGEVEVAVPGDAPFGFLPVMRTEESPASPGALAPHGRAYTLWPPDPPLDAALTLSFPLPESAQGRPGVAMYRSSGGGWSREGGEVRGDRIVVTTGRLGTFMALEDTEGPVFREVLPADGYRASTKRPYVRAEYGDSGSGVAEVRVTCGEQWLLMEEDGVRGKLEWVRDVELPSGEQTITFTARDNAGNTSTLTRRVVVP